MQPGIITEILFPLSTVIVMFGLGTSLTVGEFRRLAQSPAAILVGLGNQLLLLPLIAFGLAMLVMPRPELAVGLVVLAAAPGGIVSNILTHMLRGDVALSITLTTLSSSVNFLIAPLWIGLALHLFWQDDAVIRLPMLHMMAQIALLTVLPVMLGLFVHHRLPRLSSRMRRPFQRFSTALLIGMVAAAVISERANLVSYLIQAGPATILLNLLTLSIGWVIAYKLKLSAPQRIAVALETGIQNVPVAITVAVTLLGSTAISIPAATYAVLMLATPLLLAFVVRHVRGLQFIGMFDAHPQELVDSDTVSHR